MAIGWTRPSVPVWRRSIHMGRLRGARWREKSMKRAQASSRKSSTLMRCRAGDWGLLTRRDEEQESQPLQVFRTVGRQATLPHGVTPATMSIAMAAEAWGRAGQRFFGQPQGLTKIKKPGNDLLSHCQAAVPSARQGLTSVFGMGTGGSPAP